MINLLSPDAKKQLRAARVNTILRKYFALLFLAAIVVVGIYGVGFFLVMNDKDQAIIYREEQLAKTNQYADVRKSVETYQANLKIARTILSTQVPYSQFLIETAKALPANTIMSNISLSTSIPSTQKSTVIQARAKSYDDVLKLKANLEASLLYDNVSITNTTMPTDSTIQASGVAATYPVLATLSAHVTPSAAGATQ